VGLVQAKSQISVTMAALPRRSEARLRSRGVGPEALIHSWNGALVQSKDLLNMVHFLRRSAALALIWAGAACGHSGPPPAKSGAPKAAQAPSAHTVALGRPATGEPVTSVPVEADDAVLGDAGAPVTIVAFFDFECAYCMKGFETLEELAKKFPSADLRIALKHLPLEFHPRALPSALATQAVQAAAGPRVAYEFARALFRERDLSNGAFVAQAETLGVERALYTALVEDDETRERVAFDMGVAKSLGLSGTPAFFVNGRLIAGAVPIEEFEAKIQEELTYFRTHVHEPKAWSAVYAARVERNLRAGLVEAILADDPGLNRVPIAGSPAIGPSDAPLTLVMFSDLECPYCKRVDPTVTALQKQYGADLRLVWKHLPLPFHAHARNASRLVALAYERLGSETSFRAIHELFRASPALEDEALRRIGTSLGLKDEDMTLALSGKNADIEARLTVDAELAEDLNAHGTPVFFINGRRVAGARPIEHFQAVMDAELAEAQTKIQGGIGKAVFYDQLIEQGSLPGVPEAVPLGELSDRGRPTLGPESAPFLIHVFSDFQCPYCRRAEMNLADFKKEHQANVRWVWHDLPLPFHTRALPAARAGSEAFRQKGAAGFWEMHDLLFGLHVSTSLVSEEELLAHAEQLHLRLPEFRAALDGKRDQSIEQDKVMAKALGISGTPAFVIQRKEDSSGYIISGAQPPARFERLLRKLRQQMPTSSP
jgi:protein-disulfide isomerase